MPTIYISKKLVIIGLSIILAAWFLVGRKTTFLEKIGIILSIVLIYAALKYFSGSSIEEILSPILQK
ncbi:MAG: hypothetical protein KAR05_06690 [Candidatus Omnitrophica bacterium]|nr:hypothetical protein [Candidatus Omnitrophota bacterium]